MATKTISIDIEAYRRLKKVQQKNESFSQTIKRIVPEPISTEELIELFRAAGDRASEGFYRGVESALASRDLTPDKERIHGLLGHIGAARSHGTRRAPQAGRRPSKAKAA